MGKEAEWEKELITKDTAHAAVWSFKHEAEERLPHDVGSMDGVRALAEIDLCDQILELIPQLKTESLRASLPKSADERAAFELAYPVPVGIYWEDDDYYCDPWVEVTIAARDEYRALWKGWQTRALYTSPSPDSRESVGYAEIALKQAKHMAEHIDPQSMGHRPSVAPINEPLRCEVSDGRLEMTIGINVLRFAAENCERFYDGPRDTRAPYIKVTDADEFAKEICREIEKESETGITLLNAMIDKAIYEAVGNGCFGVDHDFKAMEANHE